MRRRSGGWLRQPAGALGVAAACRRRSSARRTRMWTAGCAGRGRRRPISFARAGGALGQAPRVCLGLERTSAAAPARTGAQTWQKTRRARYLAPGAGRAPASRVRRRRAAAPRGALSRRRCRPAGSSESGRHARRGAVVPRRRAGEGPQLVALEPDGVQYLQRIAAHRLVEHRRRRGGDGDHGALEQHAADVDRRQRTGERGADGQELRRSPRGALRQVGVSLVGELTLALGKQRGLLADLLGLQVQLDEDPHLGAQHLGVHRLGQVVTPPCA